MDAPLNILAIIPAYNEAASLEPVITGASKYLPVVVVDDGSTDQTATLARAAGASVVGQSPNQGKGAALRAGFRFALDYGCPAVLTLDADGQHDPEDIQAFLIKYQQDHPDLIIGQRNFQHIPLARRVANTLGRWTFSWAVGQPIPDNQSGYRLISRRLLEALLSSHEQGFEFEVEMIVTCLKHGYKLTWVPIRTIYADEKSHIRPLQHVSNYLRVILQTRRKNLKKKNNII